jgi:DNA polymerase III delta subunit
LSLLTISGSDAVLVNQARDLYTAQWPGTPERIDLSETLAVGLIDLLASPSLFGGVRYAVLDHLESSEDALLVLETNLPGSDAVLVACWRGIVRGATKKRLEALGTLETVAVPRPGDVADKVRSLASAKGIVLDGAGTALLSERLGGDWGRMESVLSQLRDSGLTTPTEAMLRTLCGSSVAPVAVWDVTDAVSQGRCSEALRLALHTEPVVLANWIGKETLNLAAVEDAKLTAEQAAAALELHIFRARKLVSWVRRGRRDWSGAITAAAELDIAAKSGDSDAMLCALGTWAQLVS